MPRQSARSSGPSSGARRSAPAPASSAPQPQHAPPPAAAPAAAPPATAPASGGGMMSGLLGSMAQGMAMGTGMSIANRAVDSVMGPRQTEVVHRHEGAPAAPAQQTPMKCKTEQELLQQCMNTNGADSCQSYLDMLKTCQQTM
mmetsp:Transcript_56681/g.104944  ORF Transcript_56681/g.104944 Transcript_56681/m.104944 type:complete len:143 (-) Transcript_56681:153-581(-)